MEGEHNLIQDVLLELLISIGRFFLNPLFYVAVGFTFLLGYVRVKRERRFFRTRILYGLTELKRLVADGWVLALILSIVIALAGLTVSIEWLILFSLISIVAVLIFTYSVASPIYFAALAFLGVWAAKQYGFEFEIGSFHFDVAQVNDGLIATSALIAGLLLIAESLLVKKNTVEFASPIVKKSSRGIDSAVFKAKRLWLLPILFVVPGDAIASYIPYWPQFTIGESAFSLIFVPVVIGFEKTARRTLPEYLYPTISKYILMLSVGVLIFAIGSIWLPVLGIIALIGGVLGRIAITVVFYLQERDGTIAGAPQSKGVLIIGVLPNSPAEKMGLKVGECIRKVNGQTVKNENELYDAIQINAAHCRLEVLDHAGEVRLRQHVIYRHDHYQLGLLVV